MTVETMIADLAALRHRLADANAEIADAEIKRRLARVRIASDLLRETNPGTGKPWSQTAAEDAARTHTDVLTLEHEVVRLTQERDHAHADAEALRLRIDYALVSPQARD